MLPVITSWLIRGAIVKLQQLWLLKLAFKVVINPTGEQMAHEDRCIINSIKEDHPCLRRLADFDRLFFGAQGRPLKRRRRKANAPCPLDLFTSCYGTNILCRKTTGIIHNNISHRTEISISGLKWTDEDQNKVKRGTNKLSRSNSVTDYGGPYATRTKHLTLYQTERFWSMLHDRQPTMIQSVSRICVNHIRDGIAYMCLLLALGIYFNKIEELADIAVRGPILHEALKHIKRRDECGSQN